MEQSGVEVSLTIEIMKKYYMYMMASNTGTLYVGVTGDLEGRVWDHKNDVLEGFTKKYQCHKLLYFEEYTSIDDAIAREKQLKGWSRVKKESLIRKFNPRWNDLTKEW